MQNCKILLVLTLLFAGLCGCATTPPQQQDLETTLAVWDFEDLSPLSPLSPAAGEFVANAIVQRLEERSDGPRLRFLERQRLVLALQELHLGSSAIATESTRLQVGRILGADKMVFGAFQVAGQQTRIDLRLVDVESGRIEKSAQTIIDNNRLNHIMAAAAAAAENSLFPNQ